MTQPYNYEYHEIAVAIFQWAESQVARPHLPRQYFDEQLKAALEKCAAKNLQWTPVYQLYRGKSSKRLGTASVEVEIPNGQRYGFSCGVQWATEIHEILRKLCDGERTPLPAEGGATPSTEKGG